MTWFLLLVEYERGGGRYWYLPKDLAQAQADARHPALRRGEEDYPGEKDTTLMIDRTPPPAGFSTGEFYSAPLRIYAQGDRFWLYDHAGFLCSTDSLEEVGTLLRAQATRPPGAGLPWLRARATLDPAWEEARLAKEKELREAIPIRPGAIGARPLAKPLTTIAKALTNITLEDLGL